MEAEKDKDIVVVHAGIEMDPSLKLFQERFSDRFFDVGMAEQHAVTFSAGLSCGGLKPFCIIPSAFLQRAYDQVLFFSSSLCMHQAPVCMSLKFSWQCSAASFNCEFMHVKLGVPKCHAIKPCSTA